MPVAGRQLEPRFPQAPFPLSNGTIAATPRTTTTSSRSTSNAAGTSRNAPAAIKPGETKETSATQTPSSIPSASYVGITVAPVAALPPASTAQTSIPEYKGQNAIILNGYCAEPGYTILDGPTALWVPVVGCLSSKSECCPQPTAAAQNAPAPSQSGNVRPSNGAGGSGGGAEFPISSLPSQAQIQACPKDYHTVTAGDGTACCPSSYWLWSTQLGGQIPCYSSLDKAMVPPPIPESLAFNGFGSMAAAGSTTANNNPLRMSGTMTAAPFPQPTAPGLQKPTSAIVNIAYAMQYKLAAADDEPVLKKETKMGIGVGAAAGGVLILALIAFLIRRFACAKRRTKTGGFEEPSAAQRFGDQVDMSRVAHEPPGVTSVARTHDGAKYAGVSSRPVDYRD